MNDKRYLLFLCFVVTAMLPCCERQPETRGDGGALSGMVGETVRVQFRRDALGAAASLPISPTTGEINGASTTLVGTLTKAELDAIVVEGNGRLHWIPREVILLVQAKP